MTLPSVRPRVLVYEDELERIGRHVVDRRFTETGGELYGLFTVSGSMVVHLASGPGPAARHAATSFHQDRSFLRAFFARANDRHALQHLGTWHSHHGLDLAEPSGGDDASMVSALSASGLPGFLLVIANLVDDDGAPSHRGTPEVRAFLYRREAPEHPVRCEWLVLPGSSPVRASDRGLVDVEPRVLRTATRVVPQAAPEESGPAAPDLALVHALRAAPWALEEAGVELLGVLTDALGVTSMRPNEVGELTLGLPGGATLVLGALEDEERLAGALVLDGPDGVRIEDVTGSPATLVARVRRLLSRSSSSVSADSPAYRLSPRSTSL